jgi:ATP-dependent protease HslVU (ClpYQ) peptidase subunit
MSTIVVVKKAGRAVIAADTMTTSGSTKITAPYLAGRSKVHQLGDNYIGTVGSAAHNNVLASLIQRHSKKLSFKGVDDGYETMRRLHPILKDDYYINTSEGRDEEDYESSQMLMMIANPYGIFEIGSWRDVFEYERFWAVGSGRDYAIGAMYAVYERLDAPEQIAEIGVSAGCEFDDGSGLPFTIHSVPLISNGRRKRSSRTA